MRTCSRSRADCNATYVVVGGTGSETSWFSGVLVQADNNTANAMPRNRFAVVSVAAIAALLGSFNVQLDFDWLGAAATTMILRHKPVTVKSHGKGRPKSAYI